MRQSTAGVAREHSICWPEHSEDYLQYLQVQRRSSTLTLHSYGLDLQTLGRLAENRAVIQLQRQDIRRFVARLHGEGLSARSIARTLSAWRGFFRWLGRQHLMDRNPAEGVRPPKAPKNLPDALSVEQAGALLDSAFDENDGLLLRDHAMFELLYSSGLRLAELASLNISGQLNFAEGLVTVLGKRHKYRTAPVGEKALQALHAWLEIRPRWASAGESALFVTRTGTRMSHSAIRSRLGAWSVRCGLGTHVHPHMLRHSCASHVLQSSGDLRAVQEMLGHSSIRSTQVYTHLDFQHLAKVYDAAHPRAKKKTGHSA